MLNCHILKVKTRDIGNGPGIRVSVWVAGCSHQCKGCHNPETWKWNQGTPLTQNAIDLILQNCSPKHIRGLTLTGGDPLFPKNREGVTELCKQFRNKFGNNKSIWLWTGYNYEDIKELVKHAAKEANPLYPVPVLFDAKELETIYHQIKIGKF